MRISRIEAVFDHAVIIIVLCDKHAVIHVQKQFMIMRSLWPGDFDLFVQLRPRLRWSIRHWWFLLSAEGVRNAVMNRHVVTLDRGSYFILDKVQIVLVRGPRRTCQTPRRTWQDVLDCIWSNLHIHVRQSNMRFRVQQTGGCYKLCDLFITILGGKNPEWSSMFVSTYKHKHKHIYQYPRRCKLGVKSTPI